MLIQSPTATSGSCFCWILSSLLVMAGSGQRIGSKTFMQYAAGVIANPVISKDVLSDVACAAICQKQLCLVSLGEFQWTPDSEAKLFGQYLRNITGYHFGQDGYFYKLFADVPKNMLGSKQACFFEQGATLPVPHPDFKYQALMNTPGVADSNISFYLGAYRNNTNNASDSVWVTDDGNFTCIHMFNASQGVFFDTNNKTVDMDQKWGPMQPNGDGAWMTGYGNGTWDDTNDTATRQFVCRKSVARYVRSPANGIYYWASSSLLNQALAQERCEADGGTLAMIARIVNVTATEAFRARLRGFSSNQRLWVAGTDNMTEGAWVISDTTTIYLADRQTDPFQLRFFAPYEPLNTTSENCLSMMSSGVRSEMCSASLRFLCQISLA